MTRDNYLLNIGNWRHESLHSIVNNAEEDIIINWIHYLGVKDMMNWLIEKDSSIEIPKKFVSICELCNYMLSDSKCIDMLLQKGKERHDDIVLNKIAHNATIYSQEFSIT